MGMAMEWGWTRRMTEASMTDAQRSHPEPIDPASSTPIVPEDSNTGDIASYGRDHAPPGWQAESPPFLQSWASGVRDSPAGSNTKARRGGFGNG